MTATDPRPLPSAWDADASEARMLVAQSLRLARASTKDTADSALNQIAPNLARIQELLGGGS